MILNFSLPKQGRAWLITFQETLFFVLPLTACGFKVGFGNFLGVTIHPDALFMNPDHPGT